MAKTKTKKQEAEEKAYFKEVFDKDNLTKIQSATIILRDDLTYTFRPSQIIEANENYVKISKPTGMEGAKRIIFIPYKEIVTMSIVQK